MIVKLSWDVDELGPMWMNIDNLKLLLFSKEKTLEKLLRVEICETENEESVKALQDKIEQLRAEIERLRRWSKTDAAAARGESHSQWCESQLADCKCNCPMGLRAENKQLSDLINEVIALFDKYSESFGLSDTDFPKKNYQDQACEFEEKFNEWVCKVRGHEFIADQCGKPEHDYCHRCNILKSEFERAT